MTSTDTAARPAYAKASAGQPAHTPGPWRACHNGECTCGQIWSISADHPVATAIIGEWGDNLCGKAEDRMVYGSVSAGTAAANARLIAAAPETAAERDRLKAVNADLMEALENIRHELDHLQIDGIRGTIEPVPAVPVPA
mgnify:FL=1